MHRTNENKPGNMQDLGYRFSIQVDPHDPFKPLSIVHMPPLNLKDSEMTERVIRSENLSMERLLVHSIYVRTRARLQDLKTEIQGRLLKGSDNEASLHGTPPVLSIPILQYCLKSELLLVTIGKKEIHNGPENLKKSRPKNSLNEVNQFQKKFFFGYFPFLRVKF